MAKIVKFTLFPIGQIDASAACARVYHTDLLEKSVREFGFVEPLVVDESYKLVCGRQRYLLASKLGMPEVPCVVVDFSKQEADAFRLVDNKVGEKSNWNWCELNNELGRIGDTLERYELSDSDDEAIIGTYLESKKSSQESLF